MVNDDDLGSCSSSATSDAREAAAARRRRAPSNRHAMRPGGRGPTVVRHDVWARDDNDVFCDEGVPTFFLTLSPSLTDVASSKTCSSTALPPNPRIGSWRRRRGGECRLYASVDVVQFVNESTFNSRTAQQRKSTGG